MCIIFNFESNRSNNNLELAYISLEVAWVIGSVMCNQLSLEMLDEERES